MGTPQRPSHFRELVRQTLPHEAPRRTVENDLDSLLTALNETSKNDPQRTTSVVTVDRVQAVRQQMIHELIPIFVELMDKYSKNGISLNMDASNFLEGGREIRFEFGIGEHRTQLMGTVTTEAIAFHETRFSPEVRGELVSGPMLRLRQLNGDTFREFVCERLAILLRSAARRR